MILTLIFFIILLVILGAMTGDSFVFTVIYFISISIILSNWWLNYIIRKVKVERKFPSHVFPGEVVSIDLVAENTSILPAPWLFLQESVAVELAPAHPIRHAFNLGSKANHQISFKLFPHKRGYYSLGPLSLTSGDLLGLLPEAYQRFAIDFITVYPRIFSISNVSLRSRSPMGGIKNYQPLNEDPSRPIGKRDYRSGDSLRRIDWKSSATTRKLQVKVFEPSIAYQTLMMLDLNPSGYYQKSIYDGSELAIEAAASLASWLNAKKQAFGLVSNGIDSLTNHLALQFPPRSGSANLMKILETLARIRLSSSQSIEEMLLQNIPGLPSGTSLIMITGHCDAMLFTQLERCFLLGKDIVLILCGEVPGLQEIKRKAGILSIPVYHLSSNKDFKGWQLP